MHFIAKLGSLYLQGNMQADSNNSSKANTLQFKIFPAFAEHLLNHKAREFARKSLELAVEADIPILKYFGLSKYSEEQLIELSIPAYTQFLTAAMHNQLSGFIEDAVVKWETNQLPDISKDQLVVEDITLSTHIRKKALLHFISTYTADITKVVELIYEIDDYTLLANQLAFKAYIRIHEKKLQEINESLAKHETELLDAQEIAGFGSFEWKFGGGTKLTPQLMKIFDMSQTSSLPEFLEFVHPGDREKLKAAIERAISGDGEFDCEYRYRKNGIEKVLWSKGLVSFTNGKPEVMKGTVMDITDRQHMLQTLKRNEELYKQAQKLTHIGNWTWDLETNAIKFSDELYRIYGLEIGEPMDALRFFSFVHDDDKEKVLELLNYTKRTHQAHTLDYRLVRKDGTIRIIRRNAEVLLDEKGNPYKMLGTGQDITKEVELNKEIMEREENFSHLIKNAPDGIIVIDEESKIRLWNEKATRIFGWESKEVIGMDLTKTIIPEKYHEAHKKGMQRFLNTGQTTILNKTIEVVARNRSQNEFYISLTISRSIQNDRPVFVAFIRDISDEKKIKSELEQKKNELAELNLSLEQKNVALERSNKELTSFTYVASHDLQEPIRKIKTFINLALEKEKNISGEGKEIFERIVTSASRMQKLIDDLLSFSRTQSYNDTTVTVDLNFILNEVRTIYADALNEKRLTIEAGKLPTVKGVSFQLQQLFENIISNSIKYRKKGRSAEVKISCEKVNMNEFPFFNIKDIECFYKISFQDNGIGFDQKYADKIFEIFQRLHGKNEYSGTGIGLSICKRIVENHNGFITAQSVLGTGATFDVYLPCLTVNQ
jgi:PAS domain S-box-containing protein